MANPSVRLLSLSLIAVASTGCGDPLGLPGGSGGGSAGAGGARAADFAAGNNSAVLSGPTLGSGGINFNLHKQLTLTVREPSSSLSAVDGYLLRPDDRGANTILIRVKNVGAQPRCMVGATDLHLMAGTTKLVSIARASLIGAVGTLSTIRVDSCLAAGELGVMVIDFFDDVETDFAASTELKLTWDTQFEDQSSTIEAPTGRVVPTGYSLARNNQVELSFTNKGTTGVRVNKIISAQIIGINSRGEPTDSFIATQDLYPASGQLAVGASGTVVTTINSTHQSEKLWVFMKFDDEAL